MLHFHVVGVFPLDGHVVHPSLGDVVGVGLFDRDVFGPGVDVRLGGLVVVGVRVTVIRWMHRLKNRIKLV